MEKENCLTEVRLLTKVSITEEVESFTAGMVAEIVKVISTAEAPSTKKPTTKEVQRIRSRITVVEGLGS